MKSLLKKTSQTSQRHVFSNAASIWGVIANAGPTLSQRWTTTAVNLLRPGLFQLYVIVLSV